MYVRNGSVCHLDVHAGGVDAMVVGSDLYHVVVRIRKLGQVAWKAIRAECAGRVGSVLELLQGRLSDHVLRVVTDPDRGLFPKPGEITLTWLMASGMARGASRASCSPAGGQTSRRRRERSGLGCRGRDLEPPPHRGRANFVDAGRRQAFAASLALGVAALPA